MEALYKLCRRMFVKDDTFIVHKGSLCFDIPLLFTSNSKNCFQHYFTQIESIREKYKDDRDLRKHDSRKAKLCLLNQLRSNALFKDAQANFCPPYCPNTDYDGRFLCQCFSLAVKFLDDDSQEREIVHIYLNSLSFTTLLLGDSQITMNATMHVSREGEDIHAHLVFDMPIENKTVDEIISMKHLFYKNSVTVQPINSHSHSLREWKDRCIKAIYKVVENVAPSGTIGGFEYSILEITSSTPTINVGNANDRERNQKISYGLLNSDEGWRCFPDHLAKERLENTWTSRDYLYCYFLGTNTLIYNYRDSKLSREYKSKERDIFSKYIPQTKDDNKYVKYINSSPCMAGVDSLLLFNFQKFTTKREILKQGKQLLSRSDMEKVTEKNKIRILQQELMKIRATIDSAAFNIAELDTLNQALIRSFGIEESLDALRDAYEQRSEELKFKYEDKTNNALKLLTILTLFIGFIQIILVLFYTQSSSFGLYIHNCLDKLDARYLLIFIPFALSFFLKKMKVFYYWAKDRLNK